MFQRRYMFVFFMFTYFMFSISDLLTFLRHSVHLDPSLDAPLLFFLPVCARPRHQVTVDMKSRRGRRGGRRPAGAAPSQPAAASGQDLECQICGKVMLSISRLKKHQLVHTGVSTLAESESSSAVSPESGATT